MPSRPWRLNRTVWAGSLRDIPEGAGIPKAIYATAQSKTLPALLAGNIERIRALNPGWTHQVFDDADRATFIAAEYGPEVLAVYERIAKPYGAARADLFRYLLIYRHGGVYLDIKSSLDQPLDTVLRPDEKFILAHWPDDGTRVSTWGKHAELAPYGGREYQQWHIIAAPGHPYLRQVILRVLSNIERYSPGLHGVGAYGCWRVTGPIAYTIAIDPIRSQHGHRLLNDNRDIGLVYSVFPDLDQHKSTAVNHYTTLRSSVVDVGPVNAKISAAMLAGKRAVKNVLRR